MCSPIALGVGALVTSTIGTGMGIYQGFQQANAAEQQARMQAEQQRAAMRQQQQQQMMQMQQQRDMQMQQMRQQQMMQQLQMQQQQQNAQAQYNNAVQQQRFQNQAAINKYMGDVKAQQANNLAAQEQYINNEDELNRVMIEEQLKLRDAKAQSAFKAQALLAKAIGDKGRILATGKTGAVVGALTRDIDRQAGFAQAELDAGDRRAEFAKDLALDSAVRKKESADNQVFNNTELAIPSPFLAPDPVAPEGIEYGGTLGVPTYNWSD